MRKTCLLRILITIMALQFFLTGLSSIHAKVEAGLGFLKQDPTYPHWVSFDDGTYPYFVGTTNYDLIGTPDQNVIDTIDWQAQYFNVMRVSLRPKRNLWSLYGKQPAFDMGLANAFGGSWSSPTAGWNQQYWDRFNTFLTHAASKGMIIELIVSRDGHKEYNALLDATTFNQFMAETSKHWNLIYNISNEYKENITTAEARDLASRIRAADPNRHLITVHMLSKCVYDFWDQPWSDFAAYQCLTSPGSQNQMMNGNWSRNEPQINEEYGYEGRISADEVLARHWAMVAGGGMAFYGHSPSRLQGWYMIGKEWGPPATAHTWLGHMRDFINERVSFWRMKGDNAKLVSGSGWVLSEAGKEYLVVLPSGGSFTIDLGGVVKSLPVEVMDAKTGAVAGLAATGDSPGQYSGTVNGFSIVHIGPRIDPTLLGKKVAVGSGEDPDVAVASDGRTLHVVYYRSGTVYYKTGTPSNGFGPEITIGVGTDPRIDLDSFGVPHVVVGSAYFEGPTISYTKWNGSGFDPLQVVVTSGVNRKPRIEIDTNDYAVISYEDRTYAKCIGERVRYVRVAPDGSVSAITSVGDDNNGGLGVDSGGLYHFTWRMSRDCTSGNYVFYSNSSGPGNASAAVRITPPASDFSELDVSPADDSIHAAGEVTEGAGIYYVNNAGGQWGTAQTYAVSENSGALKDDVNPAIAVDALGRRYITFAGAGQVAYYFVIDENDTASAVLELDTPGGTTGGKYKNPNVEEAAGGGAYVAWGSGGIVYVNSIGVGSTGGTIDSTPPTAPQNVIATAVSDTQIDLTWVAATDLESGIDRYNIYRNGAKVGESGILSFSDTGLSEATSYSYTVSATNGARLESAMSTPSPGTTLVDTTPPTIVSVSATGDPTKVVLIFSEPVEQASASASANYTIDNGITVSSASLGADFVTLTLDTFSHTEGIIYSLTVNNVMDRATVPNDIATDTQISYSFVVKLVISGLSVLSGRAYQVEDALAVGDSVYIDRPFTISSLPASLEGKSYIMTANDDKNHTEESFLSFSVNQKVKVYVGYDVRAASLPGWMSDWTASGESIGTTDVDHDLYAKDFVGPTVTLGGNMAAGASGAKSNYSVIVQIWLLTLVGTNPVRDLDGDGRTEDINGNGKLDFADIVVLHENLSSPQVQDNWALFDFDGSGTVDNADLVALFNTLLS